MDSDIQIQSHSGDAHLVAGVSPYGHKLWSRECRGPSRLLWMGRGVVIVVCYARMRVLLASSLGNESVIVSLPLPAHETVTAV